MNVVVPVYISKIYWYRKHVLLQRKHWDIFFLNEYKFSVIHVSYFSLAGAPVVCSYSQMCDSHHLYHFAHKFKEPCFQPWNDVNSIIWLWRCIFVQYGPRDLAYTISTLLTTSTISLEVEYILWECYLKSFDSKHALQNNITKFM